MGYRATPLPTHRAKQAHKRAAGHNRLKRQRAQRKQGTLREETRAV